MTALALEPQPLAFRVRPQADECFDSWIDRVADAHEATRITLFRHLGVDAALAALDFARGMRGIPIDQQFAVHQMIGQLAWAVHIEPEQIESTFLNVDASAVLPRRLRRYVCPGCWQEARREGRAAIIRKEWILRMSWRCRLHDIPLVRLPVVEETMSGGTVDAWLVGALAEAESLRRGLGYRPRLVEWNVAGIDGLLRASRKRFKGEKQGYLDRFLKNRFHFARHRIAMLALAHSRVDKATWGFEQLVAMELPERPGQNEATLQPPRRLPRSWRIGKGRGRRGTFEADVLEVLLAYAHLRDRRDAPRRVDAQFDRHLPSRGQIGAIMAPI
jgi:hypothetical protein